MATNKEPETPEPQPTVVEEHPELDPNEPGIDDAERERRRQELERQQG